MFTPERLSLEVLRDIRDAGILNSESAPWGVLLKMGSLLQGCDILYAGNIQSRVRHRFLCT